MRRGFRCVRDEIYELRQYLRRLDVIDIYKDLERIAANPCCNRCVRRRTANKKSL
jgi:hypothetical protein